VSFERVTISDEHGRSRFHRIYLIGTGKTFGVFLHHFVGSDARDQFHDHPWSFGLSVMLRGEYVEERLRPDGSTARRTRRAGSIAAVGPLDMHRVELRARQSAWTLFVHGPKVREWRFLDVLTVTFRSWRASA